MKDGGNILTRDAELDLEKYGDKITGGAEVIVGDNESLESALRRFKRSCAKSGILAELRKRELYEKPSGRT